MITEQTRRLARLHLDVAHALYQARERAGLSVEALAALSDLSPDRIVMIEEGDTTSLTEIAQLCDAMEIRITSVFPEDNDNARLEESALTIVPPSPKTIRRKRDARLSS